MTTEQKLEKAMALLHRTGEYLSDTAPDRNWWRDYFEITGEHMVLIDDCWETPAVLVEMRAEDLEFEPDDEINAPALSAQEGK